MTFSRFTLCGPLVLLLATTLPIPAQATASVVAPALTLEIAVDRAATACTDPTDIETCTPAASSSVAALPGDDLIVRYTIENTGTVAFTVHDLVDSDLGVILSNFAFALEPGNIVYVDMWATAPAVLGGYPRQATWSASDGGSNAASAPANYEVLVVSILDQPPTADAGLDRTVVVGQRVTLDGSASFDPDGDPLSYAWALVPPAGSSTTLDDGTALTTTFCADVAGGYDATLTVNDGTADSAPASVTITALAPEEALDDLSDDVEDLGPDGTGSLNGGQANALNQKLRQAQREIERGRPEKAAAHLAAFGNQIASFVADGTLDEEEAQALFGSSESIAEATSTACNTDPASAPAASATTGAPAGFALGPAYPNPLRASATITYDMPAAGVVRLAVFDALGRTVAVLADGPGEAGRHSVTFDAGTLPSGLYLVRLTAEGGVARTQRLTVLR